MDEGLRWEASSYDARPSYPLPLEVSVLPRYRSVLQTMFLGGREMNWRLSTGFVALAIVAAAPSAALAHCQIPCGIYDDAARFVQMKEDVTTIEKSMKQIQALSQEQKPDWNQVVRWVLNKETHADKLTETVTYYFMAQRIKPTEPGDAAAFAKYVRELRLLHEMTVNAMKAKQTTELNYCAKLRELIAAFQASYMGEQPHSHGAGQ
jgi:nickel superoxide dismutase